MDVLVFVDRYHAKDKAGDPDHAGEDHGKSVAFEGIAREVLVHHEGAAGEEAESEEDGEGFDGRVGVKRP